jgi:hypothetical protein
MDNQIIFTTEQKLLRTKIEFIFRLMFDLGGSVPLVMADTKMQLFFLSQVLTACVKVFHQTREEGKIDTATKPSPHAMEIGRALQGCMNELFNELEKTEQIVTSIPIMIRQAPIYVKHVNKVAEEIERIYSKPQLIKPQGMFIIKDAEA